MQPAAHLEAEQRRQLADCHLEHAGHCKLVSERNDAHVQLLPATGVGAGAARCLQQLVAHLGGSGGRACISGAEHCRNISSRQLDVSRVDAAQQRQQAGCRACIVHLQPHNWRAACCVAITLPCGAQQGVKVRGCTREHHTVCGHARQDGPRAATLGSGDGRSISQHQLDLGIGMRAIVPQPKARQQPQHPMTSAGAPQSALFPVLHCRGAAAHGGRWCVYNTIDQVLCLTFGMGAVRLSNSPRRFRWAAS
jgi:hypothetical protein